MLLRNFYYQSRKNSIRLYSSINKVNENIVNLNIPEVYHNCKNNVFLFINHRPWLGGAAKMLYELAVYLSSEYNLNIIILDVSYGPFKEQSFGTSLKYKPLIYSTKEDLIQYFNFFRPVAILSNSIGEIVLNVSFFDKFLPIIAFYFHETINMLPYIHPGLIGNICLIPKHTHIFVVSQSIQKEFTDYFSFTNISIFTPFLTPKMITEITNPPILALNNPNLDFSKITFIMSGAVEDRKGHDIFKLLSLELPQFNFIWIGGKIVNGYRNIITGSNYDYIFHCTNPFYYYSLADYFLLTSREEPFGLVILESLFLNIPCIVLDKNIKYDHPETSYYMICKEHNNNVMIIKDYILSLDLQKKNTNDAHSYVKRNFLTPKRYANLDTLIEKYDLNQVLILSRYHQIHDQLDVFTSFYDLISFDDTFDLTLFISWCGNKSNIFDDSEFIQFPNNINFSILNSVLLRFGYRQLENYLESVLYTRRNISNIQIF